VTESPSVSILIIMFILSETLDRIDDDAESDLDRIDMMNRMETLGVTECLHRSSS